MSALTFSLPAGGEADRTPEERGLARDEVRLLVAAPDRLQHRRFRDLPELLTPGDLVVVNTSTTLAAALDGALEDGLRLPVHVSTVCDDGDWVVELRRPDGPLLEDAGATVRLPDGLVLRLHDRTGRLRRATPSRVVDVPTWLARHGRPVAYRYLRRAAPLQAYQTVFATTPGSAVMASAGRPFTAGLVTRLVRRGVAVAPVVLHAGLSSPEAHEPPQAERFAVPAATAGLVNATRGHGRVVAVGTTVTRALESAADPDGTVRACAGWTGLVLGPERPARVVDGLVTGLHAPEASHLRLLEAVAGPDLVRAAYDAAVQERYLWHEFGDSSVFLP
jgi:S-adenosylmethionine:tRNA ribosyltransferase-isomerase